MSNAQRGKLILKEVPAGEVERKVVMLLSKFTKSLSIEELNEKVRNTPYALSNDIAAEKAALIIDAFQKAGATAVFVPRVTPKPTAAQFTPAESEPRFTMSTAPISQEKPLHVRPQPQKNSIRRLVMVLITVLFLLSLGYLTWQLWPIIGDKIMAGWDTFKNFIQSLF